MISADAFCDSICPLCSYQAFPAHDHPRNSTYFFASVPKNFQLMGYESLLLVSQEITLCSVVINLMSVPRLHSSSKQCSDILNQLLTRRSKKIMTQHRKITLHLVLLFQLFILISRISLTFVSFLYFSKRKVIMLKTWYKTMKNWKFENMQLLK